MRRRKFGLITLVLAVIALVAAYVLATRYSSLLRNLIEGKKTVSQRVAQYGPAARERMRGDFAKADVAYPPSEVTLLGIKDAKRLEGYARSSSAQWRVVRSYPIFAASGEAGPKLREGDRQVPEGIYGIESLNPNSRFHLSLRIGYPNEFDREKAKLDGREKLGGDIMIHGKSSSVGCLAMGDEAAEELFVLAGDVGVEKVKVVLAPTDLRKGRAAVKDPKWTAELYDRIAMEMTNLPAREVARID